MAFTSSTRLVNPRLGTYFGIFTAALAALVLMALMLEQLGVPDNLLRLLMFAAPLLLYATIGLNSRAKEPHDYFASGRRVPAFFNGLVLGVCALGGAGFLGLTGALFIAGFDALCLSIGWCAGLVFMTVLFAPYIRKFGTYTVPAFLGRRFDSRAVRIVAAAVLCPPIVLVLIAETRFAAYASSWLLGQPEHLMTAILIVLVAAVLAAGGMRSLTWSSVAKAITALLALAVPATIFALMASNLPLPQMTHGNTVRVLARMEMLRNVPIVIAPPLALDLAGAGMEPLVKRFVQSFGSVGNLGFVLASLVMAAGIAASPVLLPRAGTTPGVYEARKSLGWAVLVAGVVLLTLPAVAVYVRFLLFEQVIGQSPEQLPAWFQILQQAGIAQIEPGAQPVSLGRLGFERDAVLFALPIAAGFPQVLVYLALVGALAAALAALSASLFALAAIVAEDVVRTSPVEAASDRARLGSRSRCLGWCSLRRHLAGSCRTCRPIAALPMGSDAERLRMLSSVGVVHLVAAYQGLGGDGGYGHRAGGGRRRHTARRNRRIGVAKCSGGGRCPTLRPADDGCLQSHRSGSWRQCARTVGRDAHPGRGNSLRPRNASFAPEEPLLLTAWLVRAAQNLPWSSAHV